MSMAIDVKSLFILSDKFLLQEERQIDRWGYGDSAPTQLEKAYKGYEAHLAQPPL